MLFGNIQKVYMILTQFPLILYYLDIPEAVDSCSAQTVVPYMSHKADQNIPYIIFLYTNCTRAQLHTTL